MARPERDNIQNGVQGWDATVNDNFIRLFDGPLAIREHTGDESDLAATFPPASYDNCLVWVDHTVDGWTPYHSDGTDWEKLFTRFTAGAVASFDDLDDVPAYASNGGDMLRINAAEDALEAVTLIQPIIVACSDETTAIAATGTVMRFRMPMAMVLTEVRASLTTAAATGTFTVDINEGGSTILSTKLTIDATESTSTTAATPAVISDTALADDAVITIDIDDVADSSATGLKVTLIGRIA